MQSNVNLSVLLKSVPEQSAWDQWNTKVGVVTSLNTIPSWLTNSLTESPTLKPGIWFIQNILTVLNKKYLKFYLSSWYDLVLFTYSWELVLAQGQPMEDKQINVYKKV